MRRSVKYGLYGAVLAGATALTTTAFTAIGPGPAAPDPKSVALTVDGATRHLTTLAPTVGAVLAQARLRVGPHDLLAPATTSAIAADETIVLRRARELRLTVDGRQQTVWTTATTVSQALSALGFAKSDYVSVSRSQRLPLAETSLQVRKPKSVTVVHDGRRQQVVTTVATVADVAKELGLKLVGEDRLLPRPQATVTAGMQITLERIRPRVVRVRQQIAYATVDQPDATALVGTSTVATPGKDGARQLTYRLLYVDGKQRSKKLVRTHVLSRPATQIVEIGSKPKPAVVKKPATTVTAAAKTAQKKKSTAPAAPPANTSGLDWDGVASCESGGDWSINTGNGYYGGLQFSLSTWQAEGGGAYAARPDLASKADQIAVANHLYGQSGSSAWPVCGRNL